MILMEVHYQIEIPFPVRIQAPWRIGTLKYLEVKIEEWPSRAKWGQAGSSRAKWGQKWPKGPNRAKRGQMGSYGADFLHARLFL